MTKAQADQIIRLLDEQRDLLRRVAGPTEAELEAEARRRAAERERRRLAAIAADRPRVRTVLGRRRTSCRTNDARLRELRTVVPAQSLPPRDLRPFGVGDPERPKGALLFQAFVCCSTVRGDWTRFELGNSGFVLCRNPANPHEQRGTGLRRFLYLTGTPP
jgi:hypothetical protein